ncbi:MULTISPECIES: hypothetical protein [unclassified Paenibacillus]|uniref:hypothetical protein n=1 Tax=unclassified Paenibacillus TaxID=185978 RepID=UPI001AE4834B|nr:MULTISPECIES: hypothetical protein [unclassified Paenibacillus]MBP1157202.1 transposase-like protein [Paenibacillus sp. PvP091]MBP1172059.1 transposase-like protein [Paenibacillus sp. PvR098]MBP2438440.1 transposase-like protein [Paenibacillus sp. PvP052]
MPVKKGQKLKQYSEELKMKAIQMKLDGMTHREIMKQLDIHDEGRLKIWSESTRSLGHMA